MPILACGFRELEREGGAGHHYTVRHWLEDSNLYEPNSARYAMTAIVNLIEISTAETIGPCLLEGLRRIKHSPAAVNVNDSRLFLGG